MRLIEKIKIISIMALTVTLFTFPVFADPTLSDVKVCETIGVLRGTGSGLTDAYLSSTPQRYQAARLFLRLQDLEEEALAYESSDNFADVAGMADWQLASQNKAILAYLHDHPHLGFVGYTDGTFRPFDEITAMQYYKVLLTALGYKQGEDFEYGEDMIAFAAGKGLSKVSHVQNFTVSDLATATTEALKAWVKGSTTSLIAMLVENGAVARDDAISAGIYQDTALKVEKVASDNLAEIMIGFNKKLDRDTIVTDNFMIDGTAAVAASLGEDGKTVKIIIDKSAIKGNGEVYEINVSKDILAADGTSMGKVYETTLRVFDSSYPHIESIKLASPQTIEITFSEPVKTKGIVKINKGIYGCRVNDIKDVTNKVTVDIYSDKMPEGNYTLSITGFEDYAGYGMDDYSGLLPYIMDDSPIKADIIEAGETRVEIRFNKEIILAAGEEETYFYHTFTFWNPDKVLTDDNKTYVLEFTSTPLQEGTVKLVVNNESSSGTRLKDQWGNELNEKIEMSVIVSADNTPPSVEEEIVVKGQKEIEIAFTEDVKGATDNKNYSVEGTDGNAAEISSIEYDKITCKATIKFKENLTGNYMITIKGIVDSTINENEIKQTVLPFHMPDITPPDHKLITATAIDRKGYEGRDVIYVTYPEKMKTTGTYSVLDSENYNLDGKKLPNNTALELFGTTGRIVRITLPDASRVITGKILTIGRVADLAGNIMTDLSLSKVIEEEGKPVITAIKQTDVNRLDVTINKYLLSISPDAFIINVAGNEYKAAIAEPKGSTNGSTTVEVYLTSACVDALKAQNSNYGSDTGLVVTDIPAVSMGIVGGHIVSETGMIADNISDLAEENEAKATNPVRVTDGWKPSFKSMDIMNDVYVDTFEFGISNDEDEYDSIIVLNFTETISGETDNLDLNYAHDLVIRDTEDNALVAGVEYVTYVNGGDVVVVIPDVRVPMVPGQTRYTISTQDSITYIKDNSGNKINPFTKKEVR